MSATKIRRVLIANRGEIAVRVIRSCRDLGIETVAVFSDADRRALHVQLADYAVHIGEPEAAKSYLIVERIIEACKTTGADAVHPGYGFLSENCDFARQCDQAGITFIGPGTHAIEVMGSKTAAREAMLAADVPVVPGVAGPAGGGFVDPADAVKAANEVGFPVLLKAAAGGGGKGMRLVADEASLPNALEGARREARSAFGDDTVYLEKAILRPRHVEIQIFADSQGNVVHLGERDCSIQRRHQKVIEETPSPALNDELRQRMGKAAIKAAEACNYLGAGTVEFLLAENGEFYFLEMNTRLQVEHPITEMLYRVDLVAWQIRIAEGEALPMTQEQLDTRRSGAAIECRVYAEDAIRFMPSPGTITALRVPTGPYVRDDSAAYAGAEISMYYDPLISKLVVWGNDRDEALARMRRALDEYLVAGIETNLGFHRRVLCEADFVAGDYHTGYVADKQDIITAPLASGDDRNAAGIVAAIDKTQRSGAVRQTGPRDNGVAASGGMSAWRIQVMR